MFSATLEDHQRAVRDYRGPRYTAPPTFSPTATPELESTGLFTLAGLTIDVIQGSRPAGASPFSWAGLKRSGDLSPAWWVVAPISVTAGL